MTENIQADSVQRRQAIFVRCCLKEIEHELIEMRYSTESFTDEKFNSSFEEGLLNAK